MRHAIQRIAEMSKKRRTIYQLRKRILDFEGLRKHYTFAYFLWIMMFLLLLFGMIGLQKECYGKAEVIASVAFGGFFFITLYLLLDRSTFLADYKAVIRDMLYCISGPILRESKFGYQLLSKEGGVRIRVKSSIGKTIIAANQRTVVLTNKYRDSIYIVADGRFPKICYKLKLKEGHFAGMLPESKVESAYVIPYPRDYGDGIKRLCHRICIITDKGQVFHNFPNREIDYPGYPRWGDSVRFQESVIWDRAGKKRPVREKKCEQYEIYYPGLPGEVYEYHPPITGKKRTKYGGEEFGKSTNFFLSATEEIEIGRFYFHSRDPQTNPLITMGGSEISNNLAVIGTYRSNLEEGARICLFASSDGGRQWYNQYEFGDYGFYEFKQGTKKWGCNWGNKVAIGLDVDYTEDSQIKILSRRIMNNSSFEWKVEGEIKRIYSLSGELLCLFEKSHDLIDGQIVCFLKENYEDLDNLSWLFCRVNPGEGLLFKVKVVDEYTIAIREFLANDRNPICCRHIHHLNKIKDGYLLGTGEIYPNGWLYYVYQPIAEKATPIYANQQLRFIRLNFSEKSVQRTMGAMLDSEGNLLWASDQDVLEMHNIKIKDDEIRRNSLGIFMGKLTDVDNRKEFKCVLETQEPTYFFKRIKNHMIVCGQLGELFVENGDRWVEFKLPKAFESYLGSTYSYQVLGNYIIEFD